MSLTFRSQSLQDNADARLSSWYFDLIEGLPGHEPPQVRGEDPIAPGRQGRYTGNRVNDFQELLLEGFIRGRGTDPEERREDWHTNSQLILAVFALDSDPGTLEAAPGSNAYLGLSSPWEIQVRTLDVLPGPISNQMSFQTFSIRLECVDGLWWVEGS
jgi:hypothetical protein